MINCPVCKTEMNLVSRKCTSSVVSCLNKNHKKNDNKNRDRYDFGSTRSYERKTYGNYECELTGKRFDTREAYFKHGQQMAHDQSPMLVRKP